MSVPKISNQRAGMAARLVDEISAQKAAIRKVDPARNGQDMRDAKDRLRRLEAMLKALQQMV